MQTETDKNRPKQTSTNINGHKQTKLDKGGMKEDVKKKLHAMA